jgi:murein DD-endopeptidase MepM/ murein hydrolase activator NlpD
LAVGTLLVASLLAGCSSAATPAASRPGAATPTTTQTEPATSIRGDPAVRYVFPVPGCHASYGHSHPYYPATDIFTNPGCRFVAPVDGTVDEVNRVDRWDPASDRGPDRGGLSVSVIGVDGVRYYGSHLQSIAPGIGHGAHVRAGQLLGRIDNSGDARATPTHVHFGLSWPTRPGIWWIRRGLLYAWPYLDAWRAGRNLSPAPAVQAAHRAAGTDVPSCRIRC